MTKNQGRKLIGELGENIKLWCQVYINIPSHMIFLWNGFIRRESVSLVNETSVSDTLEVPAIESYNGQKMSCIVSVIGTIYSASATLIVRGNI